MRDRRTFLQRVAVAGALAAVSCGALPATAGAGWSSPVTIAFLGRSGPALPQVAVAPNGRAVAVWQLGPFAHQHLYFSIRPPGGRFGPRRLLVGGPAFQGFPHVGISAGGSATVVYQEHLGFRYSAKVVGIYASGRTAPPALLSLPDRPAFTPRVAVSPHGDVLVAWRRREVSRSITQARTKAVGHTFSAPVSLSLHSALGQEVALDAAGNGAVMWEEGLTLKLAVRLPGRPFRPVRVVAARDQSSPELGVGGGKVIVAWRGDNLESIVVRTGRLTGVLGALVRFRRNATDFPRLAVNASGEAVLFWTNPEGDMLPAVEASSRSPLGAFRPAEPVAPPPANPDISSQAAAIDPAGDAVVIWESGFNGSWVASARRAGRAFGSAKVITALNESKQGFVSLGMSGGGSAVAVWDSLVGRSYVVRTAVYTPS